MLCRGEREVQRGEKDATHVVKGQVLVFGSGKTDSTVLDVDSRQTSASAGPKYTVQHPDDDEGLQLVALADPRVPSNGPGALGSAMDVQEVREVDSSLADCMGENGRKQGDGDKVEGRDVAEKGVQVKQKVWRRRDRVVPWGEAMEGVERAGDGNIGDQKRKRFPTVKVKEMYTGGVEMEEERVSARKKRGRKGSVSEGNDPNCQIISAEVAQQPRRGQ